MSGHRVVVRLLVAVVSLGCAAHAPAPKPAAEFDRRLAGFGALKPTLAAYIVAMHRSIHKSFTVGFLGDINSRHDPAFADENLWTQLEIVVQSDGGLKRVGVVRPSGVESFDAAAVASVQAAAPFPATPEPIRSADGNFYLEWQFHRDERGCGTFGVDPKIITTPPTR